MCELGIHVLRVAGEIFQILSGPQNLFLAMSIQKTASFVLSLEKVIPGDETDAA